MFIVIISLRVQVAFIMQELNMFYTLLAIQRLSEYSNVYVQKAVWIQDRIVSNIISSVWDSKLVNY